MKKLTYIIFILIIPLQSLFSKNIINKLWNDKKNVKTVIAPFGFKSRQPPTGGHITIINEKVGIEVEQVCGYNDWATAQLHLPLQLLSKQYWKNIGARIMSQAKQTIMNLSGALPSMLACNISPTYCNVFNQAELLSQYEQSLTFDTCKLLDGVANISALQGEKLRDCIKDVHSRGSYTDSEAREICLTNGDPRQRSIKDQAKNYDNSTKGLDLQKVLSDIFPDSVKTKNNNTIKYNDGGHLYSRRTQSKELFSKVYLKGIELKGTGYTVVGGTFQTVEKEKEKEADTIKKAVVKVIKTMHDFSQKGFSGKDVIKKSELIWKNKNKWRENKRPFPIYRSVADDKDPTFHISPEQIYMMLPLVDANEEDYLSDTLHQAIDRLSHVSANISISDRINDSYNSLKEKCDTLPEYKTPAKQLFCEDRLKKIESDLDFLYKKSLLEDKAFNAQMQVKRHINNAIMGLSHKYNPNANESVGTSSNSLLIPGNY